MIFSHQTISVDFESGELYMATTRTFGPLHLEDLEPHRFEDLVRQLIYDFRQWRSLEAVGRSGSDAGFDARAIEVIGSDNTASDSSDDEEVPETEDKTVRTWLVQCKREKTISPKRIQNYIQDLPKQTVTGTYGIIFAAACNFSLATREKFRNSTRDLGFLESHLWGKGEIEDMLFQPKNDHLLFAYFGISLQSRRRSMRTEVRSKLAMKRKAIRTLNNGQTVLIRHGSDDRYPYLDDDQSKPREERGRWLVLRYKGCFHDGIHIICDRHFAFLGENDDHK